MNRLLGNVAIFNARQTIHMKCQVLFFLKTKQNIKLPSAAVVISTLRVKSEQIYVHTRMKKKKKSPRVRGIFRSSIAELQESQISSAYMINWENLCNSRVYLIYFGEKKKI